jgi:glycine/D-amino acid oxidase-like deaminating enzyme
MGEVTDIAVIGGGFYGCSIALHLRRLGRRVVILEKHDDILQRASFNNQARVHNGYHYPRSLLTALRSHLNFDRFVRDHRDCIDDSFEKYYAVASQFSKVTARQFMTFCQRIGVPVRPAPVEISRLFDRRRIEAVFSVVEYAFDAVKLKHRLRDAMNQAGVILRLNTQVTRLTSRPDHRVTVYHDGPQGAAELVAGEVMNCSYSQMNQVLAASNLSLVPLKHELTEMALVEMPPRLRLKGFTVMCGPFFSCMPFPPRGLHTLSHVRYTPHAEWLEREQVPFDVHVYLDRAPKVSQFEHMRKDSARYLPLLQDCRQVDSLWEIKTVLPASEQDDSRPILFKRHPELENLVCILGSKIDNIYDALDQLTHHFHLKAA